MPPRMIWTPALVFPTSEEEAAHYAATGEPRREGERLIDGVWVSVERLWGEERASGHTRSGLTLAQMIDLRRRYWHGRGTTTDLAREFAVHRTTASRIIHARTHWYVL